MRMLGAIGVVGIALLGGCDVPAGKDAPDTGESGRPDSGSDTGPDNGADSGADSGSPCDTGATEAPDNGVDDDCDGLVDEGAWAVGDLVITELLPDPAGAAEWIEARNVTGRRVYVNGLEIVVDGVTTVLTVPEPLAVEAGARVVLTGPGAPVTLPRGEPVLVWSGPALGDRDGVVLLRIDGVPLDGLVWGGDAGPAAVAGSALSLDPTFEAASLNDEAARWCVVGVSGAPPQAGTPGAANPPCPAIDHDGDGWLVGDGDCDDYDAAANPGATEVCDDADVDENCDGRADDADLRPEGETIWYPDDDGDGYGVDDGGWARCNQPAGYAAAAGDCDDHDPARSPGVAEVCGNGVDDNCDGGWVPCGLGILVPLSDARATFRGDAASGEVATALLGGSDLDGDGAPDLLYTDPRVDRDTTYAGAAYVFPGSTTGEKAPGEAWAIVQGTESRTWLGYAALAADFDGDGADDLLLTAIGDDTLASSGGGAYLLDGPFRGTHGTHEASAHLAGSTASAYAGRAAALLWADGAPAFVSLGAPDDDAAGTDAGAVYTCATPLSGTSDLAGCDGVLSGWEGAEIGDALAGGDLDGDGVDDLVVAAGEADAVAIFAGGLDGATEWADASASVTGLALNNRYSREYLAADDLDGDGYDDLLVGSPYTTLSSGRGAAYLFRGPLAGATPTTAADAAWEAEATTLLGGAVAFGGDVNGDGQADLLLSAPVADHGASDTGAVYVAFGPHSGVTTTSSLGAVLFGETGADHLAGSLAGVGDLDADGYDDLLLGAPRADGAGAAWLLAGGPGG